MNKLTIIGNISKEPELTQTNNGKNVCKFSIAVSRNYTIANGEKKTDFFNCIAWGGIGENISKYCAKGSKIAIHGSLETRSYQDSKGVKHNNIEIIVGEAEFLSAKPNTNGYQTSPKQNTIKEEFENDYNGLPF